MKINTIKITATASANQRNPTRSPSVPSPPRICTIIMVKIVTRADPTPAQERAMVVSPSLSLPPFVKAGIMDQYGISIMV